MNKSYISIFILVFLLYSSIAAFPEKKQKDNDKKKFVQVKVLEVVSFPNGSNVVFLGEIEGSMLVPIWIGGHEAYAIDLRLNRQKPARPVTLDILEEILRIFSGKIEKLEIDDLKSGIFLGRLYVRNGEKVHVVDTRPSDSIGLCLGVNAPIYVASSVLKQVGITKEDLLKKYKQEKEEKPADKKKVPDSSSPEGNI